MVPTLQDCSSVDLACGQTFLGSTTNYNDLLSPASTGKDRLFNLNFTGYPTGSQVDNKTTLILFLFLFYLFRT